VNVIPGLEPITVDERLLACEQALREDRHDARLTVGVLTWAINVGETKSDVRNPVLLPVKVEVFFARKLRDAVRRNGLERVVFVLGRVHRLSVDRPTCRSKHYLFEP